ncbi:MAG: hypothetical protein ACI8P0_006770, partial [Planctomycetaceae bacterium]
RAAGISQCLRPAMVVLPNSENNHASDHAKHIQARSPEGHDGMPETAVLHRLFDDQLTGGPFPEAESLLWIMHQEMLNKTTLRLEVISSGYWLDPLNGVDAYVSDTPNRGLPATTAR